MLATAVAAGACHTLALGRYGSVWAAGDDDNGQLGMGSGIDTMVFKQVAPTGVQAIAAGGKHSLISRLDGTVRSTQHGNQQSMLDTSGHVDSFANSFSVVTANADAREVAAGQHHSMTLNIDGSVWAVRYNTFGQLGDGSTEQSAVLRMQ